MIRHSAALFRNDHECAAARLYPVPLLHPRCHHCRGISGGGTGGIKVHVMLTARASGDPVPGWASNTYVRDVVAAGVRVFFYEKGYLHAKTISIDSEICSIGSANIHFSNQLRDQRGALQPAAGHGARERLRQGSRSLHRVRSGGVLRAKPSGQVQGFRDTAAVAIVMTDCAATKCEATVVLLGLTVKTHV